MNYLAIFQTKESRQHKTVFGRPIYVKPWFKIRVIKATQDELTKVYEGELLPTAKIIKLPRPFYSGDEPKLKQFVFDAIGRGDFTPMFRPVEIKHD